MLSSAPVFAEETPVIDSDMTFAEAVQNMPTPAPKNIMNSLELISVRYFSLDEKVHQGQILVRRDLVKEVQEFFRLAREHRFPIYSVIPISSPRFDWSDDKSMQANNSSGFNYRLIAGKDVLSKHAYGRAIDINPQLNPYILNGVSQPAGAVYEPGKPGVFTSNSPLVIYLKKQGWSWGGDWVSPSPQDNHHFQK
ncbi:MAG: M15 family metallopeptidase [Pseudodesulfovibrio sp.]|nr:M15 family metallopeptidase [Pseudodesulfovibrio sp.]